MKPLRLALRQYRITRSETLAAFADRLDAMLAEAAQAGADLAVLPEYASVELAASLAGGPDVARELDCACAHADALLEAMRAAAVRHRLWLLAGSLPMRDGGRTRNRAPLIDAAGRVVFQDKRVMTRFERESWNVQPGEPHNVFETPWGLIGIAICYDLEFPTLVRAQVDTGAWLILAPSCTDTVQGFNRVYVAGRARALENQCFVAIAPTVGMAPWSATLDANHGFAAVLGPIDRGFPDDGILAQGAMDQEQWLYADLDPARLVAVRREGAVRNNEDWPASVPMCGFVANSNSTFGEATG